MNLVALDWLIMLVIAGGLIRGFFVGAVRQVTSLVGLFVAFLFAIQFMHPVGDLIASGLGLSSSMGPIAGFVALFVGTQLLFFALSRLIERVIESLSLTFLNRAAGGAVGGFKAALLLSVLFLVLSGLNLPSEETRSQSVLYTPISKTLAVTLDAAEEYLPAAKRASDVFGRRFRSKFDSSRSSADSKTSDSSSVLLHFRNRSGQL